MSTRNRLGNCKNPYQGDSKRVLTVCSAGLLRSPTAAHVLAQEYGYNTRSCGISEEFALIRLDLVLLHWADELVFMERSQLKAATMRFPDEQIDSRAVVLDIPDNFSYMDEDLQRLVRERYDSFLDSRNL